MRRAIREMARAMQCLQEWNSIVEEVVPKEADTGWAQKGNKQKPKALKVADISLESEVRIRT